MYSNTNIGWGFEGHWNPRSNPVYLSKTQRVTLSVHSGVPLIEELNEYYGYWATVKFLNKEETRMYLGPTYVNNVNEKFLTKVYQKR